MIASLRFNGTDKALIESLGHKGQGAIRAIVGKITEMTLRLQRHIQTEKLEGQVLQHRTGKLINSIRALPVRLEGDSIVGEVQGAGGPAWYGRVHEFGGVFVFERHSTARYGRGITGTGRVGRKTRALEQRTMATYVTAHFPERSFMRSSLNEMRSSITEEITGAVRKALA